MKQGFICQVSDHHYNLFDSVCMNTCTNFMFPMIIVQIYALIKYLGDFI